MLARNTLIFLGAVSAWMPFATSDGQTTHPYTVSGVVRGEDNAPLSDAELSLTRGGAAARLARTGQDGKFSFDEVRPGDAMLHVRRLGYNTASMNIVVGPATADRPYDFQLSEIPSEVAAVIVEASKGHLQEFYDHKATSSFAKFFEQKEIEKRHPAFLSEMLRSVAGASIHASDRSGNHIMLRECKPMVWVDGMRAPGAELDDVARPMDVAGMEVYPSAAGLPPQYQDRNNRMCGAIVVWTRNQ